MISKPFSLVVVGLSVLLAIDSLAQNPAGSPESHPAVATLPQTTLTKAGAAAPVNGLVIGGGDLLDVSLYGVPDFKTQVRVDLAGQISLPLLGMVTVSGLTVEQTERLIEREFVQKRLFNQPQVTVFVEEYATQGISVLGEVQKPGIYQLLGSRHLYDAISAAGGTTPKAGRDLLITHRNDPGHAIRQALPSGTARSMENNVPVEPGDTIVVTKAGVVYVVGDVRQPGGFVLENDKPITVLEAIALAQGIGPNAALNAAKLIRKTPEGPKQTPLPLKQILASKAPDLPLQADDIVFVPGSRTAGATKRGAEAILQMATGVAIWRIP